MLRITIIVLLFYEENKYEGERVVDMEHESNVWLRFLVPGLKTSPRLTAKFTNFTKKAL